MRKKFFGILSAMCVCMLAACGPAPQEETPEEYIEESTEVEEEAVVEEATTVSTLTGLPTTETLRNQRPLAVMLNNIVEGCPQTGTEEASIIYEVPVEGRITRLMGIFEDYESIEKIGYVRAAVTILFIMQWNMMHYMRISDRLHHMWENF